ncbi:MAG: hypothetical protein O9264_17860 [Leptospira sp.]|nr:hypothetical protein [Leptospira sp.]
MRILNFKYTYILLILGHLCHPMFAQELPRERPSESIDITPKEEKVSPAPQVKKESGPRFFTIYPGLQITTNNLTITSPYGSKAIMTNDTSIGKNLRFFFDVKSPEWQFGESWGLFLFNKNGEFQMSSQVLKRSEFAATPEDSEKGSSYTASIGTQTKGSYSMFLPVLYYGAKGNDRYRIGFGYGISRLQIKGTSDFNNGQSLQNNTLVYFSGGRTEEDRLTALGNYSLLSSGNIDGDPIRAYLLSQLSKGNNLETLGIYSISQGEVTPKSLDPISVFFFNSLTGGQYSPIELYAVSSLLKGRVNTSSQFARSYFVFWEVPFGVVNWRVGVTVIDYIQNNFDVQLRNFETALYIPINL